MTQTCLICLLHRYFFALLLLPLCLVTQKVFSQPIKFYHIAPSEKFGFGNVWAIIEDHEGFMWFGTEDGLYKYDGYEITAFQHNKSDSTSISGNFIISVHEDRYHNIWIGTYGDGLNLYNREKNTFYHFRNIPGNSSSLPNNRIKSITETRDGTLWFGTEGGGIATFKPNGKDDDVANIQFKIFKNDPTNDNSLSSDFIRSIAEDKNGLLYVGTYGGGINVLDRSSNTIKRYRANAKDPNALCADRVIEIFIDSKNRVWLGTLDKGMDLFLPEHEKFVHYSTDVNNPHSISDDEVEAINEDSNGTLWIGTDNGISLLADSKSDVPKNYFDNLKHEPLDEFSILSNSVKVIFVDSHKSVWAGTYFGGINVFNRHLFKFHPIKNKPWLKNSLTDSNITAFAEDKDGNLWIGTDAGGLNYLPKATDNIYDEKYQNLKIINPVNGKIETKIKALEIDLQGYVWIGLWAEGIYRYDPKNKTFKYYGAEYTKSSAFDGAYILQIKCDSKNNLWIGTFARGVFYYDREKETFTNYLINPNHEKLLTSERIRTMLVDSKKRVWVGADVGGLNLFNKEKNAFERIESGNLLTKANTILNLAESRDGKIWIGTVSSGAIVYDPESKKAWAYTKDNGLLDDVVSAMLEDSGGKMWISTTKGLTVFDPKTKKTTNYSKDDGLQGNNFNNGSALRLHNGMLIFGGTNGWNAFYPDSIKENVSLPKIAFTNFWLNNKLVLTNTIGSPLTSNINSINTIALNHDQNSFSIEFAALEFSPSKNNKYAYWLEGFNTAWQYTTDRKVTFTNLFPGHYRLRVKATNQDGFWTERSKPLLFKINPAWWQTLGFKFIFAFFVLLFLYLIFRLRINYLINQKKKLTQEVLLRTFELKKKNGELAKLNNEVQSQNEELTSQNEHINIQREELQKAQTKLERANEHLEELVHQRTEKLEATIKELDKTVFELDRFVYSASHDLSAPLKSILGLVHIAKIETDLAMIGKYHDYIENSILKLEKVIKNLAEYSRNSKTNIHTNAFNFSNLANDVIQELAFWPEAKKVNIYNNSDPSIQITSDEQRIKVVLHNLVGNAIKYADLKKSTPSVKINCSKDGANCIIHIADNGIGINERDQDKVFEMYYRATDRSEGSGLGLFIVKEIINKLEGSIHVKSSKGVGTDFYIELPENKI